MDAEEQFVANLKRLRKERRLTQEELASRSNLRLSYVARIESRERSPGIRIIAKLARGLDVDPGRLFEGIDPEI